MELLPGFFQGATRVLISYPFDVAKVYMQTQNLTTSQAIKTIFNTKVYYKGCSITLLVVSMDRSIQYYLYEKLNKNVNPFVSGMAVGCISSIYNIPVQSLTSNIVLDKKYKGSMYNYIKNFIKINSITYLYKGTTVDLFKSSIFSSLYLGIYGNLRSKSNNHVINGIIASIISWCIMFPFDTIRTRLQTSHYNYKQISYSNLWRGLTPVLLRTGPSAGTGMFVYEYTRSFLKKNQYID